ncbi:MAG: ABC transporter ATP-binding protein [Prevotellaceae bacterium]|nr:ABC transporter ATP-binding protein [Prevotellaceae bacterium]
MNSPCVQPLLQVKNLVKYFYGGRQKVIKAVDGVSFDLQPGESLGLIGESGCGKSTLARLILGLEVADQGDILLEGQSAQQLLRKDRLAYYQTIQTVFQNPYDVFDQRLTIGEILLRPLQLHGLVTTRVQGLAKAMQALEQAGLLPAEDYIRRYPYELSGGQLQRIAILRAMLLGPRLLIADEPVTNLDVSVRAEVINMLLDLQAASNMALIFISHDLATTAYLADRLMVMQAGKIVEEGATERILTDAQDPYTRLLLENCQGLKRSQKSLAQSFL